MSDDLPEFDVARQLLEAVEGVPAPGPCEDCASVRVVHRSPDDPDVFFVEVQHDDSCPAFAGVVQTKQTAVPSTTVAPPRNAANPDERRALELLSRWALGDYAGVTDLLHEVVAEQPPRVLQLIEAMASVSLEILRPDLNTMTGAALLRSLARQADPRRDEGAP